MNVFENRVLRKLSGLKRNAVTEWRRLNNEELTDMYYSAIIIRVITLRRMRRKGHVASMQDRRDA